MISNKNEAGTLLPMTVTEGVTVRVLPDERHEYLMTTREVASGYGVTLYSMRKTFTRHAEELIEGKHFVKGETICPPLPNAQPHQVFWTKRGIVRLGFFIKSERARLFRDWAEELVIRLDEQRDLFGQLCTAAASETKRKRRNNRLTPARLVSIMADVCRIDDRELRLSLTNKIMEGERL